MNRDIYSLKKDKEKLQEKYKVVAQMMESEKLSSEMFTKKAQEINDIWLQLKKIDTEIHNCSVMKTLGDLYGC